MTPPHCALRSKRYEFAIEPRNQRNQGPVLPFAARGIKMGSDTINAGAVRNGV